ncbi:MAG: hypothetical protein HFE51_10415 [Clostridia bacterium]|nr:hypothetical protein [Clostridia bacterium]
MSLKLHNIKDKKFDGGCLAYLGKAVNVAVTENLQQPHTLSFDYPLDDKKADMVQEYRIVSVEGQAYRLTDVTRDYSGAKILKAKAERIFFTDAKCTHLPTIGNDTDTSESTIGCDPYKVLRKALAKDSTMPFELIPDSELTHLGMKRIGADGVKIDFFPTDKINLYDLVQAVIDAYGHGELYVDNFRFAIVERIGKDNGIRLSLTKNLSKLSVQRQTNELTTRLYPYGTDDLTISSIGDIRDKNGFYIHRKGNAYIDSPHIADYGIIEGYKDYSEYILPEKIEANAEWDLMGEGNDYRLDTPQLTITGEVIDLSKLAEYGDFYKIALGDTVHVYEKDTVHHKRIINMTYYPYSAKQPTVTIGSPTLSNPFYAAWQKGKLFQTIQKNQGSNKKFKTTYFTGTLNSTQNPVKSENEKLLLDGDLLYINDDRNRRRIDMGNLNNEFVFNLYDEDGNPVIHFDEHGNMIVTGTMRGGKIESDTDINVTKDAIIGQYLRVGFLRVSVNEGIPHYEWCDESGIILSGGATIKTTNGGNSISILAIAGINLDADLVRIKGKRVLTEADLNDVQEEIETLKERIAALENK